MTKPTLLFFRHGNTFEEGQPVIWIGAQTDLKLTALGETQAQAAARYVEQRFAPVGEIVSGPLHRTSQFAEIIATHFHQHTFIDDRLREIDYGSWEGLTRDEIIKKFGAGALEPWEQKGLWPEGMDWQPSQDDLQIVLRDYLQEQHEKLIAGDTTRIGVTSNGILRTIYGLVTGKPSDVAAKVNTGNVCVLEPEAKGWRVAAWNETPG